jgi:cyanophycinase
MYPSLLAIATFLSPAPCHPVGHLVIAGGGALPPEIPARALTLVGGKGARVLVIPQASRRTDAGQRSAQMWRKAGAEHVMVLTRGDQTAALDAVRRADLIWMSGGSQRRLMAFLRQRGLADAIRVRFHQGATVGGSSAGAAVMSRIMLAGGRPQERLTLAVPRLAQGLGLWPEVIVDMHYLRRARFNRLLGAVLGHPAHLGIGIDESTAVVVAGRSFEVIGRSNVEVIDARRATESPGKPGGPEGASNILLTVLKPGMKFDLGPAPAACHRGAPVSAPIP